MLYSVTFVTVNMIQFRGYMAVWKKKAISKFISPTDSRNKRMSKRYHQRSPKLLNDCDEST